MPSEKYDAWPFGLDEANNENKRRYSLQQICTQYREILTGRDPHKLARLAAMSIANEKDGSYTLGGEHLTREYKIKWPSLAITDYSGQPASLQTETLWLQYLERADGQPLAGRWVNLSEIGGLFYQQAFQGYCGNMLAEYWGDNIDALRNICIANGGWPLPHMGDLAFEWRALPRLPVCLCYRLPAGEHGAWATILFDAAADHYVAADVAAIVGKKLADRLISSQDRDTK